jgi:hypothetical protein
MAYHVVLRLSTRMRCRVGARQTRRSIVNLTARCELWAVEVDLPLYERPIRR